MKKRLMLWVKIAGEQRGWLSETLRNETVGGALLLLAALSALVIANGPLQDWFFELRGTKIGPDRKSVV